ncbi:hypothetical protein [Maribacter forsetii]|uniref:hypothetical protein n=1 Tax=Maribacter forsetii TaxID=444515 RepID=UPI00055AE489|nr:hypothetical protein [Maribacter forsetii]
MSIKLSQGKKELFAVTNPYFKDKGYKFNDAKKTGVGYSLNLKHVKILLIFDFKTKSSLHKLLPFSIFHEPVENLINEIGKPNFSDSGNVSWRTVKDSLPNYYESELNDINFNTLLSFRQWGHLIVDYAQGPGKAFIDTYSYLPNVLKEMDRLEAEGKYWKEILVGGIDHLFRGLIISKLCDDPNFNMKFEKWDSVIYQSKYKIWHSYYNTLKDRLKTVEPLYPYYKSV